VEIHGDRALSASGQLSLLIGLVPSMFPGTLARRLRFRWRVDEGRVEALKRRTDH
jgi:hypothetical protein